MHPILFIPLSLSWLLLLPACGKKAQTGPTEMPPAAVSFTSVKEEKVTITRDLPGRIDALRVSEVRARVPGILLERVFTEGSEVKAGDVLFRIDPAPLEATRDGALAALSRAEANDLLADTQVKRLRKLAKVNAASQQDLDQAEISVKLNAAEVISARASLKTAELNLGYATVTAPISGRIGRAQVTEGALVGQNDATLLAVIQQLDPIYFDFTQSSSELIELKRAVGENGGETPENAQELRKVTLLLDNGEEYEHPGKILFSEVSVDPTTGMVSLRAEFPNPDRLLLPGMFARARVTQSIRNHAVTVPQQAVTRAEGGKGSVLVIDDQNHVQLRTIETGNPVGDRWVVTSGLKAGERVVMEGHLKARPGSPVAPEPFVAANGTAAPVVEEKQ
jgi:membrane fusion protein, multidrug efflux system